MAFRERRTARHGAPARRDAVELDPHDPELDSYLAALSDDGGTGGFGTAQVFQVRLPAAHVEQLAQLAEEQGTSAAALATDWIVERLGREDTRTSPLPVSAPPPPPAPGRRRRGTGSR
jgi:hypothetical protein